MRIVVPNVADYEATRRILSGVEAHCYQGDTVSDALGEAGNSGMGVGGSAAAPATFALTCFLADATTGRRSTCTGFGTNRGAESTSDVSERTEMVSG